MNRLITAIDTADPRRARALIAAVAPHCGLVKLGLEAFCAHGPSILDAAGGGGWGAVVTSNILAQGGNPRRTIGTVNTAEFVLTVTISATFIAALGWEAFTRATVGLLIGGVLAAPLGAFFAKRVNADLLLTLVGTVVTITSLYGLYRAL